MGRIFVLAASKTEVDPLARLLGVTRWNSSSHAGPITAGPNQIEFFITGMGPKQAGERTVRILSYGLGLRAPGERQGETPDVAIVIGFCGSLMASLTESAIVVYSSCLSAINGGPTCPCASELSEQVTALLNAQNVACRSVLGITSPRVATTKDDKLRLAATGAQVVDMESYEVLSAAHKLGVPAIVVRVVSDSLDRKLPDFNRALNPDGSINNRMALRVMLGSPLLTARAYIASARAARHLARALGHVLLADFCRRT
jgi:hypothetical protein